MKIKRLDLVKGVTWKDRMHPQERLIASDELKFVFNDDDETVEIFETVGGAPVCVYVTALSNVVGWVVG